MSRKPLRIGLIGCGTVGSGVAKLLLEDRERIEQRTGRPIELVRIAVRRQDKPRPSFVPRSLLTTDLDRLLRDPEIHVVIELIGGIEPARQIIHTALSHGKDVVTANKAVLATFGTELFRTAREHGRVIAFEASVAGGIPIVSTLAQGLAANRILSIKAILNGTTNYILTQMTEAGWSYEQALAEAQKRGYAEADPTLDVDGSDSAHKLAILCRIAFGSALDWESIERRGIAHLPEADLRFAGELGYVVKLLAEAWWSDDQLAVHVEPTLIKKTDPLADVRGVYNAIHLVGDVVGETLLYGLGAGQMPTTSAVMADLIDLAVGRAQATFESLRLWEQGRPIRRRPAETVRSRFYLRVNVQDRPGVLAQVAGVLGRRQISIASVIQHEAFDDHEDIVVPVVIMTHSAPLAELRGALEEINRLACVASPSVYYPVAD
ncbi:MAG: homoserine dehydrogenase [Gemmataceae bacterium]